MDGRNSKIYTIKKEKRTNEEDSPLCQKNKPMYVEKCTDNTKDNCFLSFSIFYHRVIEMR